MSSTLEATRRRLQLKGKHDRWCEITSADYVFLSSPKPEKVKFAYKTAIEGASIFEIDSAQAQLRLFRDLQIFPEKVASALAAFPQVTVPSSEPPARVIVFSGHMIDEPQAPAARFPNSLSAAAKEAIRNVVARQKSFTTGSVTAVAGGACGGDLLFLEVCDELGIPAKMFLPLMPDSFSNTAVNYAGPEWQDRFRRFISKLKPTCFAETDELPLWLTTRKDYTSWQRANLWLLQEALALQSQEISLIALWDGVEKPGFGGVSYMIAKSKEYGALVEEIPIAQLSTVNSPNPVTPP